MPQFSVHDIGVWSGNALSFGAQPHGLSAAQFPAANGDQTQVECAVPAGVYKFSQYRITDPDQGIVDTYLNGVLVNTWDGYSAGMDTVLVEIPGLELVNGFNYFRFTINGKNVASTDYNFRQLFGWLSPQ